MKIVAKCYSCGSYEFEKLDNSQGDEMIGCLSCGQEQDPEDLELEIIIKEVDEDRYHELIHHKKEIVAIRRKAKAKKSEQFEFEDVEELGGMPENEISR